MLDTGKLSKELFEQGYNCAEAVWLGLNQDLPDAEKALGLKLSSGFGGGAACGSICGAVAGAVLAIGRWYGRELDGPRAEEAKIMTKAFVDAFKEKYGSIDCSVIKPDTQDYRATCAGYVEFCASVVEKMLDEGPDDDDCG